MANELNLGYLAGPRRLYENLQNYAQGQLSTPPNFGAADKSFASLLENPMLFQVGGGNVLDPAQTQANALPAYAGERRGIAGNYLSQLPSFADLLTRASSGVGDIQAQMTEFQAQQQARQNALLQQVSGGGLSGIFGF